MNLSNIKDIATTIAGWVGGIGLAIALLNAELAKIGVTLPNIVVLIGGVCAAVSAVIIGILNGRNPNGSKKSVQQVNKLNEVAATDRAINEVNEKKSDG